MAVTNLMYGNETRIQLKNIGLQNEIPSGCERMLLVPKEPP